MASSTAGEGLESALPAIYPVPDASPSWWRRDAELQDTRTTAELPAQCDCCVIGAGITGAATARRLAVLGHSVVVVEARGVAGGATGRNGGHLYEAASDDYPGLVAQMGGDEAMAKDILQFQDDTVQAMIDRVAELQLPEAELFRGDPAGSPTVAGGKGAILFLSEEHRDRIRARIAARKAAGAGGDTFEEIGAEEARERFNAPGAVGAMLTRAGSVWAAKLTVGLMKDAIANGANLQCNRPNDLHIDAVSQHFLLLLKIQCHGRANNGPYWVFQARRWSSRLRLTETA